MERHAPPPFFSTADPDSFARRTLLVRKPAILDRIVAANDFSDEQKSAMRALKEQVLHGTIPRTLAGRTDLHGIDSRFVTMWMQSLGTYGGSSWLDIPFYFAEAFLYFSILLAIGYFDRGSTYYLRDPYQLFKDEELHAGRGGMEIGRVLVDSLAGVEDRRVYLRSILHSALWGNRVDLSLFSIAEKSRERVLAEGQDNLLIDHSEELIGLIDRADRIDFILDNSGQELVCDLIAVWHILSNAPCKEVVLHAKRYPFYVSDAMMKDIFQTIGSFIRDTHPSMRKIGAEIEACIKGGRVAVKDHPFWNGPLHYPDFTEDIRGEIAGSDLVILKGDINYRRTVSDRRWRVSERLEEITGYFPTSFALLRTMKSEAVVDIDEARAARLDEEDPEWKVNGERGMIRVVHRG